MPQCSLPREDRETRQNPRQPSAFLTVQTTQVLKCPNRCQHRKSKQTRKPLQGESYKILKQNKQETNKIFPLLNFLTIINLLSKGRHWYFRSGLTRLSVVLENNPRRFSLSTLLISKRLFTDTTTGTSEMHRGGRERRLGEMVSPDLPN